MLNRKTVDGYIVVEKDENRKKVSDLALLNEIAWNHFTNALFVNVYDHHAPLLCGLGPTIAGQHEYRIAAVTHDGRPIFDVLLSNKSYSSYNDVAIHIVVEWPEDAIFVPSKHRRAGNAIMKEMRDSFAELVYNGYVITTEDRVFDAIDFFYRMHRKSVPFFGMNEYKKSAKSLSDRREDAEEEFEVRKRARDEIGSIRPDAREDKFQMYIPLRFRTDEPRVQLITPLAFLFSRESLRSNNRIDRHRGLAREDIGNYDPPIAGRSIMSFLMSGTGESAIVYL